MWRECLKKGGRKHHTLVTTKEKKESSNTVEIEIYVNNPMNERGDKK